MSQRYPTQEALVAAARGARPDEAERARYRAGIDGRLAALAAAGAVASGVKGAAAAGAGVKLGVGGALAKIVLACAVVGAVGVGGGMIIRAVGRSSAPALPTASTVPGAPLLPTAAPGASAPRPALPDEAAPLPAAEASRRERRLQHVRSVNRSRPVAVTHAPIAATAPSPPPESPPPAAPSPITAAIPPPPPAAAPAPVPDPISIAAEVALLRQAQASLKAGDAAGSLRALATLESRHPHGVLVEEREAARVLALCAAGRTEEAQALGRAFLARRSQSVQAAAVRASCAFRSEH